ncbi:MAG: nitrate/nitrite transporter NrtS [Ilumatobacteraceae bacterium]
MTAAAAPPRSVPPWSSPLDAARLIARGATFPTSSRVAAIVGTVLSAINQGSVIVDGDASTATWIRVAVNYLVPFCVSSIGYLAPFRVSGTDAADPQVTA